jgi:hypothetical protein
MVDDIEIIIEVYKMLCKIRNLVEITLNYHRIVSWEELLRNIILMVYKVNLGIVLIQPLRLLPAGNKMYFPYPRGKLLYSPEPILEKAIIPETCL